MKPPEDFDLDAQLRALHAPERSEEYWADFSRRVTGELRTRPLPRPQRSSWLPQLASGQTVATLALFDETNWIGAGAVTLQGRDADGRVEISGVKALVPDAMAAEFFAPTTTTSWL